jgi:Concanavalin A-like lectin/glucanases superfamily
MSLEISLDSHDIDFGSGSSIDDLSPFTFLLWYYPTSLGNDKRLLEKGASAERRIMLKTVGSAKGNIRVFLLRSGTFVNYITNNAPLSVPSCWHFLAVTVNLSNASGGLVRIYAGGLSTQATECSYGTTTDGSGSLDSDAGGTLLIGSNANHNNAAMGYYSYVGYVGREMSVGEIRAWQWRPGIVAGTTLFAVPGYFGTSSAADLSGFGNHGVATTSGVVRDHVPLGPPFGFDMLPAVGGGGSGVLPRIRANYWRRRRV